MPYRLSTTTSNRRPREQPDSRRFIASKLVALCRRVVHTRSFEYLLLHLIRTAIKRRNKLLNMKRRVTTMKLTPTMKGAFIAGIGLWLLLWAALFKARRDR